MSRLPLRVRLVAGFSLAMLVLLTGAGAFVYWRVEYALDRGLDTDLTRATEVISSRVGADGTVRDRDEAEATGTTWQVLSSGGAALDSGGPATERPLLSPAELVPGTYDSGSLLPASDEPYRIRVSDLPGDQVLLVGAHRDRRDEALRELLLQLVLAGGTALVVASAVGYGVARFALAPVERYRRRADEIAAGAVDVRLDVPDGADDEVTRLGHTLNEMLDALDESLARERRFVQDASHELRTPLTLLRSRIQLARRRPRSVADHEEVLEELEVDVDRLAALAEQLLELSTARPSREVLLDRVRTNLVTNAERHGAPPVRETTERRGGYEVVTVSDAGPGMPAELLATATERFTRAPEARSRPGAGLGLALVARLVHDAGGELRLCHAGHHVSYGVPTGLACTHGPEMTATAYLPLD
ncbi:ATP-binding protein [Nocardioides anomalus]|nr:ATP-binding protein [Nocardioides anomalus]